MKVTTPSLISHHTKSHQSSHQVSEVITTSLGSHHSKSRRSSLQVSSALSSSLISLFFKYRRTSLLQSLPFGMLILCWYSRIFNLIHRYSLVFIVIHICSAEVTTFALSKKICFAIKYFLELFLLAHRLFLSLCRSEASKATSEWTSGEIKNLKI